MNCQTGEVQEDTVLNDWTDKLPNFGHQDDKDKEDQSCPGNQR